MAKKKQSDPANGLVPPAPSPNELPKSLEYVPRASTERWRVERFDLLAAQIELSAPWDTAMQSFHEFAERHSRTSAWFLTRRLFGVMPLIPVGDLHPDDLRVNTREELSASMAISLEQIKAELDFLKAGYSDWIRMDGAVEQQSAAATIPGIDPGELALDDKLLRQFGFSDRLFRISIKNPEDSGKEMPRPDDENKLEREWFCSKLRATEWQKMLQEPLASALARETLVNELYLHRLQQEMMPLSPSSSDFQKLSKTQQSIEGQYREQLERLQEKFPEMAIAGRVTFKGCISDLNLAHRQYYGNKDNRLWNKVHTAAEIVFLTRSSVQLPSARFRLGWEVAVVEAINGFYNPDFRSLLPKSVLKKLDAGCRAGIEAARQELGEKVVNLESGVEPGEGDDYPDFPTPKVAEASV